MLGQHGQHGQRLMRLVEAALVLSAAALLTCFPKEASAAAVEGVTLCLRAVIPSLFPFFVVTSLLISLGLPERLGRRLGPLPARLLGIGPSSVPLVLLGLIGGYPLGATAAAALYRRGGCSREEGERLLIFANNCGPSFILGLVGQRALGDVRAALGLLLLHWLCALWLGALLGARADAPRLETAAYPPMVNIPLAPAFTAAVRSAGIAILNVCAYVLFFTVVTRFLPMVPLLRGCLELTGGILALDGTGPLRAAQAAFLLGFGGLSVYCQTQAVVALGPPEAPEQGLRTGKYLPYRLLHGLVSAAAAYLLFSAPFLLPVLALFCLFSVKFAKRSRKKRTAVL